MENKGRVLSGVQPTGGLHLGNYLGAIKNFIPFQDKYQALYCVVDQHAITVAQDPEKLKHSILTTAAAFIASGVSTEKAIIFHQSGVPEHVQLSWVLECTARMGWLNRMTQFKDKAGKNKENASVGLFSYPILMAADILCYHATHIPVGADQKQHIELARDIAVRFNLENAKHDFFPLPEPVFMDNATRVMSLRDGTQKMSKSDPSDYSRIHLSDSNDEIALKFRKAKTDAGDMPVTTEDMLDRPEIKNLFTLYSALTNTSIEESLQNFQGKQFSSLKSELADATIAVVSPIRNEMEKLLSDEKHLENILKDGARKASDIARPIVREVYDIVGFL